MKKILQIIICCFALVFLFHALLSPQTAYADTSIYRSAGWVSTDGSPAYSNTTGCQISNDGLYCFRINASSYGNLYFSSFGNLENFGIPPGSYITKLHIRVKGKNTVTQYVGVNSAKNYMPFSAACNTPSDLWPVYLGQNDNTVEKHTFTSSNGLTNCVTASNIDQERLTFRLNLSSSSSWNADIDNFEIAFDYNLPTYPWKIQGDTNIPRNSDQAVLLSNGKVLVAGGIYVAQSTNIVEIFTPVVNGIGTWTQVTRMNHDRKYHTLNLIPNKQNTSSNVLAVGGAAEGCSCIRNSAELYNPSLNTWTMTPNMNYARAFHASSVLEDGNVLVSGGTSNTTVHNSTEVYDTTANAWTIKAPLNVARVYHQQVTFRDTKANSKVMVIGGSDASGKQLASTEIYDPSSNTWILGPTMNSTRYYNFSAVTLHDGRILVVGGNTTGDSEIYDPVTDRWTAYPTSYNFHQGSVVELGSDTNYKVLAAGSSNPVTTNAMLFDPQTNTWNSTASMNAPRTDFTLTLLKDGTALAASGISSYQQTRTSEIYTPSSSTPTPSPSPIPTPPAKTPLILIPGIGGSEFKSDQFFFSTITECGDIATPYIYLANQVVWLDTIIAATSRCDDYFDVLKLNTDGQTPQYAQIVLNGTFVPITYGDFIKFFINNGYELNNTLFLFPYDWRKDVALTASLLDQKIEFIKEKTGTEKVDIVSHSMGGLVAKNYISDLNRSKNVQKLITLGAPNLGATEFIKNLMYGGCLTPYKQFEKLVCLGVSPSEVKDVIQNMISGFELAPSQAYFDFYSGKDNLHPLPFRDDRDIDSNDVTGPLDYPKTRTMLTNLQYNTSLFDPSEVFHSLDNMLNNTNGVEVTNIVGSGRPTLGQIIEKYSINFLGVKIPKRDKVDVNGDETVPLFSASLIDSFNNKSLLGDANVFYTKQEHGSLVSSGPALNLVKNILESNDQLPNGVSNQPYHFSGTRVSVHSPVNIHVYDAFGNHTGPTINEDSEANIPGSSYDTLDDAKFIWLPDNGQYTIKLDATDQGSFDFKIRKFEDDINTQTTLYKDVPITSFTKAQTSLDTSSTEPPVLQIDQDGNGTIDTQASVFSVLTGNANYDFTPPTISFDVNPKTIWPPDGKMIDVNIKGLITDENPYVTTILVEDEYDLVEPSITTFETEINQTIQLEALRREDDKDGRKYTIKVLSTDLAGNTSLASVEALVPHDQRKK